LHKAAAAAVVVPGGEMTNVIARAAVAAGGEIINSNAQAADNGGLGSWPSAVVQKVEPLLVCKPWLERREGW
jgi:hypothetical protein